MSSGAVVLKFGGTSLASARRVLRGASRVQAHLARGAHPVVVVSANGGLTDAILGRIRDVSGGEIGDHSRETDRALATGEDLSAALFACALAGMGVAAVSLRGGDAGLVAEGAYGAGRVREVRTERLRELLESGVVPVVAGFQAGRMDGETVTLGRGGSDISAVAIAAALGCECHIITDVAAVFDRDPRTHTEAVRYATLEHRTLVEIARGGAKVVHPAAAEMAARSGVPLRVYHFGAPLSGRGGTRVGSLGQHVAA